MAAMRCLAFLAAALLLMGSPAGAENGWRWGRATFYGIWWSLHHGSCGYGHLDYWKGTGWDVAAIPDAHYEYQWSCGKCYEVKCEPMNFKDNYGNHLDRSHVCYDPNKVVTVTIVDSCPCNYPSNAYSNKRWCCGDMDHFDLSYHTFDKLADRRWGVIGLKYRPVACPGHFRLENRHHLGRKLMEEGKGPQMHIIGERYLVPEYNQTGNNASFVPVETIEPIHITSAGYEKQDQVGNSSRSDVVSWQKTSPIGSVSLREIVQGERDLLSRHGANSSEVDSSSIDIHVMDPISVAAVELGRRVLPFGGGANHSTVGSGVESQVSQRASLYDLIIEERDLLAGGPTDQPGTASPLNMNTTNQGIEPVSLMPLGLEEQDPLFGGSSAQHEVNLTDGVQGLRVGSDSIEAEMFREGSMELFFEGNGTKDNEARGGYESKSPVLAEKLNSEESEGKIERSETGGRVLSQTEKAELPPFSLHFGRRAA